MKHIVISLLAASAVSLASLALAQQQQPAPAAPAAADRPAMAATAAAASGNTRLAALVPAGLTPEDACRGFKDLSECSAALHVAQNLDIPFADLKDRVTAGQSLGTAIHALKPKADSRREAERATEQAREDLRTQG
ncbi:MAG TPA: hypothetical protein VNY70_03830 [Steroidobacteraceae bacterium]|nr:hypothetical protein [Steroidobacteraceae bacterium]